jgi:hypothetical protein
MSRLPVRCCLTNRIWGRPSLTCSLAWCGRPGGFSHVPGTVPVGVIDGMADTGKTALAVQAAHRLAGKFPDGNCSPTCAATRRTASPARRRARHAVPPPPGREEDSHRPGQRRQRGAGPPAAAWRRRAPGADQQPPAPVNATCALTTLRQASRSWNKH